MKAKTGQKGERAKLERAKEREIKTPKTISMGCPTNLSKLIIQEVGGALQTQAVSPETKLYLWAGYYRTTEFHFTLPGNCHSIRGKVTLFMPHPC